jgi:WD40 repeat protein
MLVIVAAWGETPSAVRAQPSSSLPIAVPVSVSSPVMDEGFAADGRLYVLTTSGSCRQTTILRTTVAGRRQHAIRFAGCAAGGALGPGAHQVATFTPGLKPRLEIRGVTAREPSWRVPVAPTLLDDPHAFWSGDGRRVLTETDGPKGRSVFDARNGRRLRTLKPNGRYVGRQPFSPDGRKLVFGGGRGPVVVDIASGAQRVLAIGGAIDRPAWSSDGTRIAGTGGQGVVWVDVATGAVHTAAVAGVEEVAWSPDGSEFAAYGQIGDDQFAISVVDVATGSATVVYRFPSGWERGELAWSPDGRRIAFQVDARGMAASRSRHSVP